MTRDAIAQAMEEARSFLQIAERVMKAEDVEPFTKRKSWIYYHSMELTRALARMRKSRDAKEQCATRS